jgi:hypothetical protein
MGSVAEAAKAVDAATKVWQDYSLIILSYIKHQYNHQQLYNWNINQYHLMMQHKREKHHKPQTKHNTPLSHTQNFGVSGLPILQIPTLPAQPVSWRDNVLTWHMHWNPNLIWKFSSERDCWDSRRGTAMYRSSDRCKGDGNGIIFSESRVEGGWLPDQRGVLRLDNETT